MKVPTLIRLEKEIYEKLVELAFKLRKSRSSVVEELLKKEFEKTKANDDKKIR